ncbi:hypothetical protein [Acidithiobacillus ferriphilus]|uniref:hypothetical protein n=1 Tax=Acidithiobacillus ferriphilus TaxID=1689834 RepID=UPI00232E727E|nr:hypothetical protein [Acidithiobacillus ferriphilus]WCE94957.1 hypothetical protein PJU76_05305 [Acidithiobacillus ferriphilus]
MDKLNLAVLHHEVGIGVLADFLLYALMAISLAALGELLCPLYRQFAQLQRLHVKMEDGPELQKIRA